MTTTRLQREIEADMRLDLSAYFEEAYYGQGMTDAQIADHLGISPSTAGTWRNRFGMVSFRDRRGAMRRAHAFWAAHR